MSIEYKSTGTLLDEMITTYLKMTKTDRNKEINEKRYVLLNEAIGKRFNRDEDEVISQEFTTLTEHLIKVLEACWNAQEEVMKYNNIEQEEYDPDSYTNCALAAIKAQKLNAQRNRLIRQIDELLGEQEFTQLEKSYDR